MTRSSGGRPQDLGLCSIQLEPVRPHPHRYIVNTVGDVVLQLQ